MLNPGLRRSLNVATNLALGLVTLLALAVFSGITVLPGFLNYRTYTVLSGSMSPAITTGSVIVALPADPRTLRVGDVITYKSPTLQENITHRIVEIKGDSSSPIFKTKGDANPVPDEWDTQYDGPAGRVVLSVPLAGYFFHSVGSPQGHLIFLVVPGVVLTLMWLWEIWRPQPKLERLETELPSAMTPAPSAVRRLPAVEALPERDLAPDTAASLPLRQ